MWGELDDDRRAGGQGKFLLDFGKVPVLRNAVRPDAFVALDKKIIELRLAPRPAHAAQ